MCSRYLHFGKPAQHLRSKPLSPARLASAKEVPAVFELLALHDFNHEIGAKGSSHLLAPLQVPHPNRRHAIGCDEESFSEDRLQAAISLRLHNSVNTCQTDIPFLAFLDTGSKR